jgi:hypothetical protein
MNYLAPRAGGPQSSDNKPAPQAPTPHSSKIALALPPGWEQRPLTEQMVNAGRIIYATNRTADSGASLYAFKHESITDLMTFAVSRRAGQASALTDAQQSEVSRTAINCKTALRFEVTGSLKTGQKIAYTYMTTIIEGVTEIAMLVTGRPQQIANSKKKR